MKQGWEPLCKFLNVPIPDCPFPRVNDTEAMRRSGRVSLYASWALMVIAPLTLLLLSFLGDLDPIHFMLGYGLFLLFLRIVLKTFLLNSLVSMVNKQKKD